MRDSIFVDTNVLIYLYSETELEKRNIAFEVFKAPNIVITTQVINEFIWVMNRKFDVPYEILREIVCRLSLKAKIALITQKTIEKGIEIGMRYKFSYWDNLIVASALENNCTALYTEDMQNGQVIEGKLKIVNPFSDIK